jgi:hypothetical protein
MFKPFHEICTSESEFQLYYESKERILFHPPKVFIPLAYKSKQDFLKKSDQ